MVDIPILFNVALLWAQAAIGVSTRYYSLLCGLDVNMYLFFLAPIKLLFSWTNVLHLLLLNMMYVPYGTHMIFCVNRSSSWVLGISAYSPYSCMDIVYTVKTFHWIYNVSLLDVLSSDTVTPTKWMSRKFPFYSLAWKPLAADLHCFCFLCKLCARKMIYNCRIFPVLCLVGFFFSVWQSIALVLCIYY